MKADVIKAITNLQEFLTYNVAPRELAEVINEVCNEVEANNPEMQSNVEKLRSLASALAK